MDNFLFWINSVAENALKSHFSWKSIQQKQHFFFLYDVSVLKDIGPLNIGDKFHAIGLEFSTNGSINILACIPETDGIFQHLLERGYQSTSLSYGLAFILLNLSRDFPIYIVATQSNQKL